MQPNPGDRPSRLQLDRYAAGELDPADAATIEANLLQDERARAHLEAIETAKAQVRPFDAEALRDRARHLDLEPVDVPRPANRTSHRSWMAAIVVAALALFALAPLLLGAPGPSDEPPEVRMRTGGAQLMVFRHESKTTPYQGELVGEGDVLGLQVLTQGHRSVVVLSIDGNGTQTVFYPASGDEGHPLPPGTADAVALPDSIVLDGAPGPESFVAVFDDTVASAKRSAMRVYESGGVAALQGWAEQTATVDVVVVSRK